MKSLSRHEFAFLVLGALFVAALVSCNLIAGKFVELDLGFKTFILSVGILPYPLTFLVTDLVSEIYGRQRANQLVLSAFFAAIFVIGVLFVGDLLPAIEGSRVDDDAYEQVFGAGTRTIVASMAAYLTAQFIDIRVFHFWKDVTRGRHLWLRNNASTIFSQFVDTSLVVLVLFVGDWSAEQMLIAIRDGWLFKMLVALADTPLVYACVYLFTRHLPHERGPHTAFS